MKKELKQGVLKSIAIIAAMEGNVKRVEWPPPCMGFIYQPKRPRKLQMREEEE